MKTYQTIADQINSKGVTASYNGCDAVNAQAAQDAIWGKITAHDVEMAIFELGTSDINEVAPCAAMNACARLFGEVAESICFELN